MSTVSNQNLDWADNIRLVSIILVILIHTSAKILYAWGNVSISLWHYANGIDSFSRISVPLFVMLSGTLLLGKDESTPDFLIKRIPRLLLPWIFWGTIQLAFYSVFMPDELLSYPFRVAIIRTLIGGIWFMPMILGLYLITPIVKPFIQKATQIDFAYFFSLWFFFASCIPTLNSIANMDISFQLPTVLEYMGYYLSGYYLTKKIKISTRIKYLSLGVFLFSWMTIATGTYVLTKSNNQQTDSFYEYTNLFVVMTSVSSFILLKNFFEQNKLSSSLQKVISKASRYSLGIYLSHTMVLKLFSLGVLGVTINALSWDTYLAIPLITTLTFLTSLSIVALLDKIMPKFVT